MTVAAVYGSALRGAPLHARFDDGTVVTLDVGRWLGPVGPADESVLARAAGPVLDVGCGPGRHVRALARRGVLALGLDASPDAVRLARERGTAVVCASVFDALPGEGSWGSALLLDGSLGIGGAPERLLRRAGELVRPDGAVLVELEPPGTPELRGTAILHAAGRAAPLRWALVTAAGLDAVAGAAGLAVADRWEAGGRHFAELSAPNGGREAACG